MVGNRKERVMITPSFSLTATERVLPRLALDFTTASLDPRVTFTRSGAVATRVNASGLVETMAANTPRFDFNPVTFVCRGLLIEEARTNLILQSSDFTTTWVTDGATVTSNSAISPDGTQNADQINSAVANWRIRQDIGVAGSTAYTCSAFVKKGNSTTVKFEFASTGGANPSVTGNLYYNFDTNTITGTGSVTSPTVTPYGNGWFRISGVLTTSASHTTMLVYCYGGAEYGSAGQTNWWGAQVEAGAFATSYIPTVASQVTRTADVATMTGTNFSSWFNASQGSFTFTGDTLATGAVRPGVWITKSGGGSGYIQFKVPRPPGTTGITIQDDAGAVVADLSGSAITVNTAFTVCGGYKVNDFGFADRGAATAVDTSGAVPTGLDRMGLGWDFGTNYQNGHIAAVRFWPQKLITAEIQAFSKG